MRKVKCENELHHRRVEEKGKGSRRVHVEGEREGFSHFFHTDTVKRKKKGEGEWNPSEFCTEKKKGGVWISVQ